MQAGRGSVRRWRQQTPFPSGGGQSAPARTAHPGPQTQSLSRPHQEPVAGTPSAAQQLTAWGPHQENAAHLHAQMVSLMDAPRERHDRVHRYYIHTFRQGAKTWTVRTSLKLDMVLQGLGVLRVRQHVQVTVWIHTGS